MPLDYSVVDDIVSAHYNNSRGDYTLYVLNPLRVKHPDRPL